MLCNGYENKSGKKVREPGAGVRGPGSGGRGPGAGVRPSRVFFRRPCVSPFCYRFASVAALTRESPPLSPPTRAAPHRFLELFHRQTKVKTRNRFGKDETLVWTALSETPPTLPLYRLRYIHTRTWKYVCALLCKMYCR